MSVNVVKNGTFVKIAGNAKGNSFTGTKEQVQLAIENGLIKEGMIVNITDDYDAPYRGIPKLTPATAHPWSFVQPNTPSPWSGNTDNILRAYIKIIVPDHPVYSIETAIIRFVYNLRSKIKQGHILEARANVVQSGVAVFSETVIGYCYASGYVSTGYTHSNPRIPMQPGEAYVHYELYDLSTVSRIEPDVALLVDPPSVRYALLEAS